MNKTLYFALIATTLLCSCGKNRSADSISVNNKTEPVEVVVPEFPYAHCLETYSEENGCLVIGADGDGFAPVADKLKPYHPDKSVKTSAMVDTLVWLYNTTQALNIIVYDASTAERYMGERDSTLYAEAIAGIDVSGISHVGLRDALVVTAKVVAKDLQEGILPSEKHYPELSALHEMMSATFNGFIDTHFTDAVYDCSAIIDGYDSLHAQAVIDTAGLRSQLIQMVLCETDFERKCIYARELAYANWGHPQCNFEELVAVLDPLLQSGEYSPILCDLWLIWRTALQSCIFGGNSNDSSMYNIFYNEMRRKVAHTYIVRLSKYPHDSIAFEGLMRLVYRDNIIRNSQCYFGNNCFLDQMELYQVCLEKR